MTEPATPLMFIDHALDRMQAGDLAGVRSTLDDAFPGRADDPGTLPVLPTFLELLLRTELDGARAALDAMRAEPVREPAYALSTRLAVEVAHRLQARDQGRTAAAVLRLASEHGHPEHRGEARFFHAVLLEDAGDPDGALRDYEAAAGECRPPLGARAAFEAACLRHGRGDRDRAAHWYNAVVESGDEEYAAPAAYQLGLVTGANPVAVPATVACRAAHALAQAGADTDAEQAFEVAAGSDEPGAARNLGVLRLRRGDLDGALAAFRRAAAIGTGNARALAMLSLAATAADAGDLAAARAAAQEAFDAASADELAAEAAVRLGFYAERAGDEEAAADAYEQAELYARPDGLWTPPPDDETVEQRGYRLARWGDRAGGLAALTEAYGSADLAAFGLAVLDAQPDEAATVFDRLATAGGPHHRDASGIGLDLVSLDRYPPAAARTVLTMVVDRGDPDIALRARIDLAGRLADIDDPAGAQAHLREVIAQGGPDLTGPAALNLANLQRSVGDREAADRTYRSILNHPVPNIAARALLGLAELYADDGNVDAAVASLKFAAAGLDRIPDRTAWWIVKALWDHGEKDEATALADELNRTGRPMR